MQPFFIALEGIDSSGKATQATLLASYIFRMRKDANVVLTRNPTGVSPASRQLRKMLDRSEGVKKNARKFLELYVKDRKFQVRRIINPALKAGAIIISERYYHSSFAYQVAQGMKFSLVKKLHKGMPVPDITMILDISPKESMRRKAEEKKELFENEPFLRKARENYRYLPEKLMNEKIIIIPAGKQLDSVFERVHTEFLKAWALKEGAKSSSYSEPVTAGQAETASLRAMQD